MHAALTLLPLLLLLSLWPRASAATPPPTVRLCQSSSNPLPAAVWRRLGLRGSGDLDALVAAWLSQRQGLQVLATRRPARRCVSELQANAQDLYAGLSVSPERLAALAFPRAAEAADPARRLYMEAYHWYVVEAQGWSVRDGRLCREPGCGELPRTGALQGYAVEQRLRELGYTPTPVTLDTAAALRMLLAGRIDAAALQARDADALLQQEPALGGALRRLEPPISSRPYYLVASPAFAAAHPQLLQQLWAALGPLRDAVEAR
jgi:polar amino acid transport system substrate-binding protein